MIPFAIARPSRATAIATLGLAATCAYFAVLHRAQQSWSYDRWMVLLLAPALVAIGVAAIRWITRNDSQPLTTLMMVALVLKLGSSFVRYFVSVSLYGSGDALRYDAAGAEIANSFHAGRLDVLDLFAFRRESFFIEDLAGLLYSITGPSRLGGFLMFSFLGYWGLVLFHRAARIGLPEIDEHRYALCLYFMPALLFWPSSIGKEAVMLPALGLCAYGAARVLARMPLGSIPLAAGLWLCYVVRPHVAFVVLMSFAVALLFRRSERSERVSFGPVGRLIAIVGVAVGAAFMLGEAIDRYIPVNETSAGAGDLLDRAELGTDEGGSIIERQTPNSPLEYPQAVFSVLFRPTLFEAGTFGNAIAAAETTALLVLTITSWSRLKNLPGLVFRRPYVLFCVVYTGIFTFAWSSFANIGALVRQRVQVWPFVLLLLALPAGNAARATHLGARVGTTARTARPPSTVGAR